MLVIVEIVDAELGTSQCEPYVKEFVDNREYTEWLRSQLEHPWLTVKTKILGDPNVSKI